MRAPLDEGRIGRVGLELRSMSAFGDRVMLLMAISYTLVVKQKLGSHLDVDFVTFLEGDGSIQDDIRYGRDDWVFFDLALEQSCDHLFVDLFYLHDIGEHLFDERVQLIGGCYNRWFGRY